MNCQPHTFVSNGTISLQLAIRALELKGEIITTPFTYIATPSSICWEGCKPVFVDIDERTFNIDVNLIEKAITPKTSAILATHVFGNPCDIDAIQKIADKHNLKVIYDAAHCFGTKYKDECVLNFGDISTISFHATKIFHTVEGGGLVTKSISVRKKVQAQRNYGHVDYENFSTIGINGKNSEFHAAMGLTNLEYIDDLLKDRKKSYEKYKQLLGSLNLNSQTEQPSSDVNGAFMGCIFPSSLVVEKVQSKLNNKDIFPRKYLYSSMDDIECFNRSNFKCQKSRKLSNSILCLPQFHGFEEHENIVNLIEQTLIGT